jgi:hypothetical protein
MINNVVHTLQKLMFFSLSSNSKQPLIVNKYGPDKSSCAQVVFLSPSLVTSQVRIDQVLKPYNQFLHQFGAIDPPSCNPYTKDLLNFCIHQTHFDLGFVAFG